MRTEALRGHVGMLALLRAFRLAGQVFHLETMMAVPVETGRGAHHLLFTIGDTTAALTLPEVQWYADQLIDHPTGIDADTAGDMERFGRMMLSILAEQPGPHGAH
jgi:hypothetical protein